MGSTHCSRGPAIPVTTSRYHTRLCRRRTDNGDNTDNTDEGGTPDAGGGGEAPSFAETVAPLIADSCLTGCHSPGGSAGALPDMSGSAEEAYGRIMAASGVVVPGDSNASKLYQKPIGTAGHVGGKPFADRPDDANAFKVWIDEGAEP